MSVTLRLAVFALCVAIAACAIRCPEDFCSTVDCVVAAGENAPPCTANQRLNEHGTWCGCCRTCVTQLEEGSDCGITLMIGGPPPVVECSTGLVCSRDTRTCVPESVAEEEEAEDAE
ncbi:hypothetical protein B7P43_G08613 [Cryptotermes secundus]|uniref:IGFBP N-terminal domain-containing protein n=1 Tax=Cryptotermes secundus TaxID=105785 RepID=A0A2J7Q604_9NEOP|nr:hypothetical protein B7P43_G08613 [Cryptotermes secundus]